MVYQDAEDQADKKGISIISIVHSHPDHPDRPSDFDKNHAWPGFSYIIISVQKGTSVSYRSWQLNKNRENIAIKIEGTKVVIEKKVIYLKLVCDPNVFLFLSFKTL